MSGGGVSAPEIKPLKNPLVQVPQPGIGIPQNANYNFPGFTGGGISGGPVPGQTGIYLNAQGAMDAVNQLNDTFQQGSQAFADLGKTVQPGFSLFRQTGLQSIENARQANQSNLQNNLAQRRVQGSSFANSSISNANADFAKQSADFIAQSYLQELNASQQLTQQQYSMATQGYQAVLNEMNLTGAMAMDYASKMGTTLASIAETQGQLDLGAAQTNAQAAIEQAKMQLQAQEFNAQMQMSEMMGIGQLAGGLLGGGMGKSDIRVKRDIKQIGEWFNGLPVYLFRYIFDPRWFIGFMAQDVEKVMPEAVIEISGIKHVNYAMAVL